MKNILAKKWHLHMLTLPMSCVFIHFALKGFLQLDETGNFFIAFITIFISAALGFTVEWIQGAFFGANKTPDEVKASNLDILACIIGGTIGVIAWGNLQVALYSTILIILLEIFRKTVYKKP